jgi:hypothetical protein
VRKVRKIFQNSLKNFLIESQVSQGTSIKLRFKKFPHLPKGGNIGWKIPSKIPHKSIKIPINNECKKPQ